MARVAVKNLGYNSRNILLNGDMALAQRTNGSAVSINSTARFCVDRWVCFRNTDLPANTTTATRISSTGLVGFPNALRYQRNSGNTAVTSMFIYQNIESQVSTPLQGQSVTFSFYARAGSNFSPTSSLIQYAIYTGTGNDESFLAGFTGQIVNNTVVAVTTSWVRYSMTITVPNNCTQLAVALNWTPVGTAGTNDYLDVTGAMLQVGLAPTDFKLANDSKAAELAACQRYYENNVGGAWSTTSANDSCTGSLHYTDGTSFYQSASIPYKVLKRISPTVALRDTVGNGTVGNSRIAIRETSGSTLTNQQVLSTFANNHQFSFTVQNLSLNNTEGSSYMFYGAWQADAELT